VERRVPKQNRFLKQNRTADCPEQVAEATLAARCRGGGQIVPSVTAHSAGDTVDCNWPMSTGIKTSKPGGPVTHPAHDVLRSEQRPLDALFAPQSVALIGATEKVGSVGRNILRNLITSPFGGTVFPIHPSRPSVLGIKAYTSVAAVPEAVELAVIATPAPTVPGIIKECVDAGVRGAIIISAGFRETGPEGFELEQQVLAEARRGRLRIIGPNCFGVMMPLSGMNATFSTETARPVASDSSAKAAPSVLRCWTGACARRWALARSFLSGRCWMSAGVT